MIETLYHGSAYLHDKLSPGFKHSGVLVKWDSVESNKWLYASSDKETACVLGLASALEKKFNLSRFIHTGGTIEFYFDENKQITPKDITNVTVYLYEIPNDASSGWVKNNNLHNGIDTEYKTVNTVSYNSAQTLNIEKVLEGKQIVINNKPVYLDW